MKAFPDILLFHVLRVTIYTLPAFAFFLSLLQINYKKSRKNFLTAVRKCAAQI